MTTGHRPRCAWGSGDLPSPYAEGDIIDVPADAKALERMESLDGPGRYKVIAAHSIDDGDAWYFRIAKYMRKGPCSGRLHVAHAGRFDTHGWGGVTEVDWLEGCTLVRTADPDGLAEREHMLADGWTFEVADVRICPTCKRPLP